MQEETDIELGALSQVRAIAGISKSEIHRRVIAKSFPLPVYLGPRCTRWNLPEVRSWAAARLAERDTQAATSAERKKLFAEKGKRGAAKLAENRRQRALSSQPPKPAA